MNKKSLILAIGPVVVLLALMIGAGVAAEGRGEDSDSGIIHACVNSKSGEVRIVDPENSCKKKWTAVYLVAATDEGDSVVPGSLQVEGGLLKVGHSVVIDDTDDSITASSGTVSFGDNHLITAGRVRIGEFESSLPSDTPEQLLVGKVAHGDPTADRAPAIESWHWGSGSAIMGWNGMTVNNPGPTIRGTNEGGGIGVQGWADGDEPAVEGNNPGGGPGVRGWVDSGGNAVEGINVGGGVGVFAWADGENPAIEGVHANGAAIVGSTTCLNIPGGCWAPTIHGINEGNGVGVQGEAHDTDAGVEGVNLGHGPGVAGIGQAYLENPGFPNPGEGVGVVAISQHGENILEAYDASTMGDPAPPLLTWDRLRFSVGRETGDVFVGGTLQVAGNYIQFPTISGMGPPLGDCNSAEEAGRVVVQTDTPTLWICTGASGWVGK